MSIFFLAVSSCNLYFLIIELFSSYLIIFIDLYCTSSKSTRYLRHRDGRICIDKYKFTAFHNVPIIVSRCT